MEELSITKMQSELIWLSCAEATHENSMEDMPEVESAITIRIQELSYDELINEYCETFDEDKNEVLQRLLANTAITK